MPLEVEKSAANGRIEKSFVYPPGPTRAAPALVARQVIAAIRASQAEMGVSFALGGYEWGFEALFVVALPAWLIRSPFIFGSAALGGLFDISQGSGEDKQNHYRQNSARADALRTRRAGLRQTSIEDSCPVFLRFLRYRL